MSWTDLFKSKAGKPKPDPRIRWFGKLPTYPDYYSSPADEGWAVEFNDWVLKGFERYRSRRSSTGAAVGRLPVSGCAIRLPKSGMTVFASILDFGGDLRGRPFPMCFYAGVPTSQWPGPTSDRLLGASRVIRDLVALRREVTRFLNSPGRFEAMFGGREVNLADIDAQSTDTSWLVAAKNVGLEDWFEGVQIGMKVKERGAWVRLALAWGDNLADHESKTFEPTLRFPLAMRLSLDAQIAGWTRWLESRMDLKHRRVSFVVSGEWEDQVGHLTVIAREVVSDDFLLLTPLAETLPYLDDLSRVEPASVPASHPTGSDAGPTPQPASESAAPSPGSAGNWVDFVCAAVTVA